MIPRVNRSKRLSLKNMAGDEKVRIWSFQSTEAWKTAKERGYFAGDERFIDEDDFDWLTPYRWMRDQMAERLPEFSGDYPVWAYLARPNLRQWRRFEKPTVKIVAEVPRARMLISDYDSWHCVLNSSPFTMTEEEDDWFDHLMETNIEAFLEEARKTWVRIFELGDVRTTPEIANWITREVSCLQACVDRIHLDEIVSVKEVHGRKRR